MSWTLTIAIFFLVWWLCWMAVLPWGLRTPDETGEELVRGQAPSAPHRPHFRRKLVVATVLALLGTALVRLNFERGWVTWNDLPGDFRDPPAATGAKSA